MARYAQFTAESFAARAKKPQAVLPLAGIPGEPGPAPRGPMPRADAGDYGSLLVVRVGRPKKRPVLMLDPAEAAAAAVQFQQIAAQDFANPDAVERRCAIMRLSAIAANESGLEDIEASDTATYEPDAALELWTNPETPVDTTDWCDEGPVEPAPEQELLEDPQYAPFVDLPQAELPATIEAAALQETGLTDESQVDQAEASPVNEAADPAPAPAVAPEEPFFVADRTTALSLGKRIEVPAPFEPTAPAEIAAEAPAWEAAEDWCEAERPGLLARLAGWLREAFHSLRRIGRRADD